jgi:hypothetical protein
MRHSRSLAKGAMLATLRLFSPAGAEEALLRFDAKDMVPLVHGPNWVDLDGDGHNARLLDEFWISFGRL